MKCILCNKEAEIEEINGFVEKITCKDCGSYYMELPFLAQLGAFKEKYGNEKYNKVLEVMKDQIKKNVVMFCADFEQPYFMPDNAIYLELEDITSLAKIIIIDINSKLAGGS